MRVTIYSHLFLLIFCIQGCGKIESPQLAIPSFKNLGFVYKIDIQQGNVITQDMLAQLEKNMDKKKISFIMGTPIVKDTFNSSQWDYIYTFHEGGGATEKRRVTLHFDSRGGLSHISGDISESASPLVAKIHQDSKIEVPRYKDKKLLTKMKEKLPFVETSTIKEEATEQEIAEYSRKLDEAQNKRRTSATDVYAGLQPVPGKSRLKSKESLEEKNLGNLDSKDMIDN